VRGAEHELVRALVVEVDEAGVGAEGVRDLLGDEVEHLLEVERRVDRGRRLGQEPEVPVGRGHRRIVRRNRIAESSVVPAWEPPRARKENGGD
jgi:hypothetical protein